MLLKSTMIIIQSRRYFKILVKYQERRNSTMRTWRMIFNPKKQKDAVFCQYFLTNTTDARRMYNTANFYIRNTMTGIKKSPELRTSNEVEVLHDVFTGIQKARQETSNIRKIWKSITKDSWINSRRNQNTFHIQQQRNGF